MPPPDALPLKDLALLLAGGGLAGLVAVVSAALKARRDARREDDADCREALAESLGQVKGLLERDSERRAELDDIHVQLREAALAEEECQRRLRRLEERAGIGDPA